MSTRKGASLLETLIVMAIIGILLAFLFPAVLSAHRKAQEMVCKNNLHQINLAIAEYVQLNGKLPDSGSSGLVGGWTIDVLPFLDQKNLRDHITPGQPISTAPDFLLRRPRILSCPVRNAGEELTPSVMDPSDYVFVPVGERLSFDVFDAPVEVNVPWASGPEVNYNDVIRQTGPHHRGFFYAAGFQNGVRFMLGGQDMQ
jgi:prepilin-type N-terminal cleavage/methylation domain-containing protein